MTNPSTPLSGNTRRSKIGRLPTNLRHFLNQWLSDGIPYQTISDRLAKLGHPGITVANLSTWSNSGHLHWIRDQEAAEQLRHQANRLTDVLAEMEGDTADKATKLAEQIAAIQIAQMLQAVDPQSGQNLLEKNPDHFFRLVRTLTLQTHERTLNKKVELEQRKYHDQVVKARSAERNAIEQNERSKGNYIAQEELDMIAGEFGIHVLPPAALAKTVNKYRLLQYRIKREAEDRARRNDWENTAVSPDPYVAAIERGEDPFKEDAGSRRALAPFHGGDEADPSEVSEVSDSPRANARLKPP